jgi:hypothetical protein
MLWTQSGHADRRMKCPLLGEEQTPDFMSTRPSWLFSLIGISFGPGWVGYLIAGFIGAVILIFVVRMIRQRA